MSAATTYAPIGGSEAAAACGLDPYKSQVRLYLEKRGEIDASGESEAARWGNLLAPVIAEEVERRGYVTMPAPDVVIESERYPFMSGHPDGFVSRIFFIRTLALLKPLPAPTTRGLLEIKTAGIWQNHLWLDGATPNAYVIQVHHYMVLTGLEWALVAALIGGQRLELRVIERDDKLIQVMLHLEAEFWRMLNEGELPAPDGSEATAEAIRLLYPEAHAGTAINLTAEDAALIRQYKLLREAEKASEEQANAVKQTLQLRMGDNELGLLDGQPAIRYPTIERKEYSVAAKHYRRFQVL